MDNMNSVFCLMEVGEDAKTSPVPIVSSASHCHRLELMNGQFVPVETVETALTRIENSVATLFGKFDVDDLGSVVDITDDSQGAEFLSTAPNGSYAINMPSLEGTGSNVIYNVDVMRSSTYRASVYAHSTHRKGGSYLSAFYPTYTSGVVTLNWSGWRRIATEVI